MKLEHMLELRRCIQVAHHIPGRIRLRFDTKIVNDPVLQDLKKNPENWLTTLFGIDSWPQIDHRAILENPTMMPGLKHVRLNLPGRTVVVEYDAAVWQPAWLDELMHTGDAGRVRSILGRMAETFVDRLPRN
ncbi:hypothetical protein DSCOOX_37060 [Desulfosarcina ovata subsp. ovata]|uniref:Uncharacterized protein n=2 Tax=Desulfosarcina ovata TaxID=83564 RepID=A0A5K8ADC0_9BACT|nr:hypothetical protein DSCOOX_37060 [Desulfosarcina ovata subsp. ovata]